MSETQDEIEQMRRDAARYRWLRDGDWEWMDETWMRVNKLTVPDTTAEAEAALDAAIDRAMKVSEG